MVVIFQKSKESRGWSIKFTTGINIQKVLAQKYISHQPDILLKWLPHGGIILAKGQLNHSYTFWAMSILTFCPVANFSDHPLPRYLINVTAEECWCSLASHILAHCIQTIELLSPSNTWSRVRYIFSKQILLFSNNIRMHFTRAQNGFSTELREN